TLLFAMAFLPAERPTRTRLVGLVVGFAGAVVVVAPWRSDGTSRIPGEIACLGAAAAYGLSFVYMRRHLSNRGHSPVALSFVQISLAAAVALATAPLLDPALTAISWRSAASLAVLGVLGTGLAYLLNYALIREAGATTTSMVTYLMPVVAVSLGVVVLTEPLHWTLFAGAAIILAGVLLAEGRFRARERPGTRATPAMRR
ncbi:MAG TPA: DMT family transporter, partial [Acidimicrobiales bacterium]|nr:DMT family transporter [Acidimicrobiales bacterium]